MKSSRLSGHFTIQNKGYGKKLFGTKIFYEGFPGRPKFVRDDGGFSLGKHILETLSSRFPKVKLTLVGKNKSQILKKGKLYHVHLSSKDWDELNKSKMARSRGLNLKIVNNHFVDIFPKHFKEKDKFFSYERGLFSEVLDERFSPSQLSSADATALNKFLPKFLNYKFGTDTSIDSLVGKKRGIQLIYLEKFTNDLERRIRRTAREEEWQKYFKQNILVLQEGYIKILDKMNIDIESRLPDFCLITTDGYLDVMEIKTPQTTLLKFDKSHKNYYWSPDIAKAISQAEKYIDTIIKNTDRIRTHIKDKHNIDLRVIKPRGIIIAGQNDKLAGKDQQNDFRLLNESLKNLSVVTYSDMVQRMRNIIYTFRDFESKNKRKK